MREKTGEPSSSERPLTLDYANPRDDARSRTRWDCAILITANVLACLWPLVAGFAGVSSDYVRIPLAKKVALSTSALVISVLLLAVHGRPRPGCAISFVLLALWLVAVMWFWN